MNGIARGTFDRKRRLTGAIEGYATVSGHPRVSLRQTAAAFSSPAFA